MRLRKQTALVMVLALTAAIPALAQVDKVGVRTSGISCGDCAAISEIYLRRLQGVDKVVISRSQEVVIVTYKAGTAFQPWDIRDVLEKTEVGVVQIQISAHGHLQEQGAKKFFVAGKDKFLLVASPTSPKIPPDTQVSIEGIVNDHTDPMQLRVLTVNPLK